MVWARKPRQTQTPREAWEAAHPARENSLSEFFLMSYFLFYPPLALPADILSCNSPVRRWAMEAKDAERKRVCLCIKRGCWEDLRDDTGSSMCLFLMMVVTMMIMMMVTMMITCFFLCVSLFLLPPFWFRRWAASLTGANFFFYFVAHTSMTWRGGKTFFFFLFSPPSVNFLPQLLVEASAYPQIIKHLRGYSPLSWNPTENDVPCYEWPRKWGRLFSHVCLLT